MTLGAAPIADELPRQPIPSTRKRWQTAAWAVLFALFCVNTICIGIETAYHFLGPAIDGPFQLYNALRRIVAGQTGGVDFQFFHGLGIPYLHYIPFRMFGGTFV